MAAAATATLSPTTQAVTGYVGSPLAATVAYTATNFTGAISYSVAPALPAGLLLSPTTGQITGTPSVAQAASTYTVTAKGAATGSATTKVTLSVLQPAVTPTTQTLNAFVGKPITATSVLTARNFTGVVTYGVSPALPAGLTLNTANGQVTGAPTVTQAATVHTITAIGAMAGQATATLTVTVALPSLAPASQTLQGTAGMSLTQSGAITATGFGGTVSYGISPALPSGLKLNTGNGVVSGTPAAALPATAFTLTGTGATSGVATALLNLTIAPPPPALSPLTQAVNGVVGTPLASRALTASNFLSPSTLVYTVAPALPAGLSLDAATGVISGTSSIAIPVTAFLVTASDGVSAVVTATVNLAIKPTLSPASQSLTGYVGLPFISPGFVPGGFNPTTFTIIPLLGAGFAINPATGIISGTPTAIQALTRYTVTATDGVNTASATLSLSVAMPSISPASQSVTGTVGSAINSTRAFTANGFGGAVTYSLNPATLPTGLAFDPATGILSGISTVASLSRAYTVSANGATTGSATATITLGVNPLVAPSKQTVKSPVNAPITPTTAVTVTGLTGSPVVYSISPVLPAGLALDSTTGIVSGTPINPQSTAAYVISVTDGVSGTGTSLLSLTVTNPPNCLTASLTPAQEGRRAYLRLNCYSCHGDSGLGGMGPNIRGEGGGVKDVVPNGSDGGMPGFSDYLCANDLDYLQAYLNSLGSRTPAPSFLHWWEQTPCEIVGNCPAAIQ